MNIPSRSVSVLFFSNMMVFMLGIPVVHRMPGRSVGLAGKEGIANDFASLFPDSICGAWGLLEPCRRLSWQLCSAKSLAKSFCCVLQC